VEAMVQVQVKSRVTMNFRCCSTGQRLYHWSDAFLENQGAEGVMRGSESEAQMLSLGGLRRGTAHPEKWGKRR